MYLLDTNAISEVRKVKPHGGLLQWYRSQNPEDLLLCSVTMYELQRGTELTRRHDATKASELEQWITELPDQFEILPFDTFAARLTARLMHHKPIEMFPDAMIAAIAYTFNLTVVTRNVRDFEDFPVPVVNPFSA